jgi:multiple sugar transport system permease protein
MEALKVFGLPYALTSGGPGTSTQVYSTMVYLTTLQFFDFGHGSAMGILFLVAVLAVILRLFNIMRRQIE